MKKLVFCLSFVLLAVMNNYAQSAERAQTREQAPTLEQKAQKKTDALATKLNLNDAQKTKTYAIVLGFMQAKNTLAPTKQADAAAYKEKIKSMGQEYVAKMNAILNKEQQNKLQAMLAELTNNKAAKN